MFQTAELELSINSLEAESELVNFDPWLYRLYPDRLDNLVPEVKDYLAESLRLSTSRPVTIKPDLGFVHSNGVPYNNYFDRSISHYADNPVLVEQFRAEKLGYQRLKEIILDRWSEKRTLPPFVIASPPGLVYDKTSLTFVGIPSQDTRGDEIQYRIYSVPTGLIETSKHWQKMCKVTTDIGKFEDLLQTLQEVTPAAVVGTPLILNNVLEQTATLEETLDKLAQELGFRNWQKIEADARIAALLEGAYDRTTERRRFFVDKFSSMIVNFVKDNLTRVEFEVLRETMRQIFSEENGGYFVDSRFDDLTEIEIHIEQLFVGNGGDFAYATKYVSKEIETRQKKSNSNTTRYYPYEYSTFSDSIRAYAQAAAAATVGWIGENTLAQETYTSTGCGRAERSRAVVKSLREIVREVSIQANYMSETNTWYTTESYSGVYGSESKDLTQSTTASENKGGTGKYKELYDYYADECRGPCHSYKPYVAHPKHPEIGCGYFCSDCEK